MTSYRSLVFNSCVWLQTIFTFLFSEIMTTLCSLLGVASDHPTDPAWIRSLLEKKFHHAPPAINAVEKASETLPGGGIIALTYRIELKYRPQEENEQRGSSSARYYPRSLVVKQGKTNFRGRLASTSLQSAREAIFYSSFAPRHSILASCVPDVYHSRGSLLTGEFTIVMEDLTGKAVPANLMLGNQCWGTPPLPAELKSVGTHEILRTVFGEMAEIHAQFWMDESLLSLEWMLGARWRMAGDRLSWEASFDNLRDRWTALSRGDEKIFTGLQREAMGKLLAGTNWGAWQRENGVSKSSSERTKTTACFSLAHGDFHAGNVLWMIEKREHQAIIVDWSQVGIGCPFTELAQFMISNTSIDFRRENERQLFEEYYHRLLELGVDSAQFPQEKCWERYKAGGIERWLQLLIILVAAGFPEFSLLWYSRQVESFLQDHFSALPKCFNSVYCLPLS